MYDVAVIRCDQKGNHVPDVYHEVVVCTTWLKPWRMDEAIVL